MVLRLESEAESEADLRSVRISELPQKLTEIATFSSKKKRKCRQIDSSFEGKEGRKKRFKGKLRILSKLQSNSSNFLPICLR